MSENTLLRIDKLLLENYRCFSKCPVDFHPKLTVLVAENAGGKTAILDALRLALLPFVTGIGKAKSCPGFLRSDMRGYDHEAGLSGEKAGFPIAAIPTSILAAGAIDGQPTQWRRERSERQLFGQTTRKDMVHVRRIARNLTERIYSESRDGGRGEQSPLPVVAYYGTGRLYSEPRLSKVKRWLAQSSNTRMSAYLDCLSPSSSYKSFSAWFGQRWEDIGESRSRAEGFQGRPENQITAVREAVKVVLEPTGWVTMDWQPADQDDEGRTYGTGHIQVENSSGSKVPLYTQSDGIRNMVALVGDLAHRCVRLNPHLAEAAARETSGIVMIDEVDMHLHPQWQQRVVELLHTAFPKIQFVLTTHSPHVLSTVSVKSIRVVEIDADGIGQTDSELSQTRGDESGNVLSRVMNVNPVPNIGPARVLSTYRGMVQMGLDETEKAQRIWRYLVSQFGEGHHLLEEAAVLRDLQVFKREHKLPPKGSA